MMHRRSDYYCLAALFFGLISLILLTLTWQNARRGQSLVLVAAEISQIDTESDHQQAIARYSHQDLDNPLIKIRIMRRYWRLILKIREQIGITSPNNPGIGQEIISLQQEFEQLRFNLQETGESLLKQRPSPEISWRVYNLLGATYLLQAADLLEKGENLKQGQAALNLAIKHFKSAITEIDKDFQARDLNNIPRWNLELLTTGQSQSELAQMTTGAENRLDLKKNLSTMLPESAGFMVGEPPDNRVRK